MLSSDFQKLEVGSVVSLIEIDCTEFDAGVLYFHGHNIALNSNDIEKIQNPLYAGSLQWAAGTTQRYVGEGAVLSYGAKPIIWQGIEYKAWPCEIEGISAESGGKSNSVNLSVGNIDGSISALCLLLDDLLQAKVVVHLTLVKYLDAVNFIGGNPDADPTEEITETFYIDSKTSEDNESISWSLSSPADLRGQIIPTRQITGLCEWCLRGDYRGADCGYMGGQMFDEYDNPTDNPEKDKCGGMVSSCKVRFGEDSELPFGGFPASNLLGR